MISLTWIVLKWSSYCFAFTLVGLLSWFVVHLGDKVSDSGKDTFFHRYVWGDYSPFSFVCDLILGKGETEFDWELTPVNVLRMISQALRFYLTIVLLAPIVLIGFGALILDGLCRGSIKNKPEQTEPTT